MFRSAFAILMLSSLLLASPLLAAPATTMPTMPTRFDVRAFGAAGDGIADDQPALARAAHAVAQNKGGVLYLPFGVYRCARQAGEQNAIEFVGVSDVTILFDPGAVLLMDNLNPQTGIGDRGHGILVRGPCRNITVQNASVKWAHKPSGRSMGDAFRFEGFPDEDKCISNIRLIQCSAELSPQTGAVLSGCSDIDVENFRVTRTYADGLHFNACRRIHVNGLTAIGTGDDALSFMTYEDDKAIDAYSGAPGSFALAGLGEWNSNGSTATNIYAKGGTANGVRFGGAINVALSNVVVDGKLRAVISDCGKKDPPRASWSWLANRHITISNVVAVNCTTAFYACNYNKQALTGDDKWWRFDIQLSNFSATDCKDDSIYIADAAGIAIRGANAQNRRIQILRARDCSLSDINLKNAALILKGQADDSALADAPSLNLSIRNVDIDQGYVDISNCKGVTCTDMRITHPDGQGLRSTHVIASKVEGISVE